MSSRASASARRSSPRALPSTGVPAPQASTRERLLDAAEALFAERGIEATTLRALTRHAGVNLAAVNYHFGSKEKLLDAVVERLAAPINAERGEALDALESRGPRAPEAAAILCAYFEPVIEQLAHTEIGRTATLARLCARIEAQPRDEVARLAERHFGAIARRYVEALARALPTLERAVVIERFRLASAVLTALFADTPELGDIGESAFASDRSRSVAARAREALVFAVAGLCAPAARPVRERRDPSGSFSEVTLR